MVAALVTTLHETNKVARCHFENGCFSKVKYHIYEHHILHLSTCWRASVHHSGACHGFTALLDDSEAPRPVKLASTAVHLKRTII